MLDSSLIVFVSVNFLEVYFLKVVMQFSSQ